MCPRNSFKIPFVRHNSAEKNSYAQCKIAFKLHSNYNSFARSLSAPSSHIRCCISIVRTWHFLRCRIRSENLNKFNLIMNDRYECERVMPIFFCPFTTAKIVRCFCVNLKSHQSIDKMPCASKRNIITASFTFERLLTFNKVVICKKKSLYYKLWCWWWQFNFLSHLQITAVINCKTFALNSCNHLMLFWNKIKNQ